MYAVLEDRLRASRFKLERHEQELLECWVSDSYEHLCSEQDMFVDVLQKNDAPPMGVADYAVLWTVMAGDLFELCKSVAAKKAMWAAIAAVAMEQGTPLLLKQTIPFLEERKEWMPKKVEERGLSPFVGTYNGNDYRTSTLVVAAQRMKTGDLAASEHLRSWLKTTTLAPGVLPVRKYGTGKALEATQVHENQLKWLEVVIPFCEKHPHDMLMSPHVCIDLPFKPAAQLALHCASRLSQGHQQWLYANTILSCNNPSELRQFWETVLEKTTDEQHRDIRLHMAMTQVQSKDAHNLAMDADPRTVALMESLGTFSQKGLADLLYTRWMHPPNQTVELPPSWFDDSNPSFGL